MAKRAIFSVVSPLGYTVTLSRDRWRQITRFKHPALVGMEAEVRNCIQSPILIRESDKDSAVHLHYNVREDIFICVVTAPVSEDEHFVVTAYLTKSVKQGIELWKK